MPWDRAFPGLKIETWGTQFGRDYAELKLGRE
jgi:hypothetical protein